MHIESKSTDDAKSIYLRVVSTNKYGHIRKHRFVI